MKNPPDVRLSYQENALCGATPIQLVVILYDAAIEDMRQALEAMKAGEVEARAAALRHALLVLQQLQGTLDFEKGAHVARQFEQFYNLIRGKLLEAQLRNSCELMQQQIQYMSEVRSCWIQAEAQLQPKPVQATPVAAITADLTTTNYAVSRKEWNA